MRDDDGYFDERVAARYDESAAEMFDPAVAGPVVDLLVELAGSGRARRESGASATSRRTSSPAAASSSR